MLNCIIHRKNRRFHITDEDFVDITDSADQTAVQRILEWKTDGLINDFAKRHALPAGHLPTDDYLWIDEFDLSATQLAYLSLGTRGRTTFVDTVESLVRRGHVRSRYIAYRGKYAHAAHVHAPLSHDERGRAFLIVENYAGEYQGKDEAWHNAVKDGYNDIRKQYLYCFDVANAAIAELEDRAPKVIPRWSPKKQEKALQRGQETHRNKGFHIPSSAQRDTLPATAILGECSTEGDTASNVENITEVPVPSMVSGHPMSSTEDLLIAPWTPETIIALISRHTTVPTKPEENDKVAMDRWLTLWYEPALWMYHETMDLEPRRAWEVIERRIAGMLRGPTWYARRDNPTPITARNIVGPADPTKLLTGVNWRTVWAELDKAQWFSDVITPYDGPPLTVYEQGYTGPAELPEATEATVPAPPAPIAIGMRRKTIERLVDEIRSYYPAISLGTAPVAEGSDRFIVGIEYAQDQWIDITSADDWRNPSDDTQYYLELAVAYAAELNSAPTPPEPAEEAEGYHEDTQPILMEESLDNVVDAGSDMGMIVPGLYLLPPPVAVESQAPEATESDSVAGMSPMVAMRLVPVIEKRGYAVHQRPVGGDRVVLSVELSPGRWCDFASASAWYDRPRDIVPPTDVGASMLPMAVMQGGVLPGQAMVSP